MLHCDDFAKPRTEMGQIRLSPGPPKCRFSALGSPPILCCLGSPGSPVCASLRTEQLQQFRLRQAGAYQSPRWPAINVNCAAPVVVNSAGPVGNEPARINEFAIAVDGRQASLCSTS